MKRNGQWLSCPVPTWWPTGGSQMPLLSHGKWNDIESQIKQVGNFCPWHMWAIQLGQVARDTVRKPWGYVGVEVDWCCNFLTSGGTSNFHGSYECYGCPLLFAVLGSHLPWSEPSVRGKCCHFYLRPRRSISWPGPFFRNELTSFSSWNIAILWQV